jgi:hypothetical protein
MLSRLLQIEDRCDSKALELSRIRESKKVLLAMLSEEQKDVTYNDHIPADFSAIIITLTCSMICC